jgi:hypothetical protein
VTGQHRRRTLDGQQPRPTATDLAQLAHYAQALTNRQRSALWPRTPLGAPYEARHSTLLHRLSTQATQPPTQPPTQPTQRREYRVYYKTLRSPSTRNRRAFSFAWGTTPEQAVAEARRHHGPLMVTSVELVSTGEAQYPTPSPSRTET